MEKLLLLPFLALLGPVSGLSGRPLFSARDLECLKRKMAELERSCGDQSVAVWSPASGSCLVPFAKNLSWADAMYFCGRSSPSFLLSQEAGVEA